MTGNLPVKTQEKERMVTKTQCPSVAWDNYLSLNEEDPRTEEVYEWVSGELESTRKTIHGDTVVVRHGFNQNEGFPDDPDEIANALTRWLGQYPALMEVAHLLAKTREKK